MSNRQWRTRALSQGENLAERGLLPTARGSLAHTQKQNVKMTVNLDVDGYGKTRAGLNEREAPGKVVTARPTNRLAQPRSVSNAHVATLQKHRLKRQN